MSIDLVVETGVPLPDSPNYFDLKVKADAACKTAELLKAEAGQNIDLSEDSVNELEKEIVASLAEGYAADPEKASKALSAKRTAQMSPASMVMVSKILGEFGNLVVNNSVEIRNLVTNKLLIETENEDPKVRIRALELLGKISDVGLFSEKHEYTVTHRTSDELRESLREKLKKFSSTDDDVQNAVDADFTVVD